MEHGLVEDDDALVIAAQAGDGEAFAQLFRRHYEPVRRVCARRLGGAGEADEVAQAAFVRAYERLDQCAGERRFGAWVQVIALRLCGDLRRAGARTTPMADPGPAAEPGPDACVDAVLRQERAAAVRCALGTLPPRQRAVLVARDVHGRRPGDVAAAMAVSVGAVDSLLLRARRRLLLACRASGVENGAASLSLTTTTAAAGSAAADLRPLFRPLAGLAESVSGAMEWMGAGLAGALGFGPVPPAAAQRVAGLVGAGALLLAPLATPAPPSTPPLPPLTVPAPVVDPAGLVRGLDAAGRVVTGPPVTGLPVVAADALPPASVPALPAAASLPAAPATVAPGVPVPATPPNAAAVLPAPGGPELVAGLPVAPGAVGPGAPVPPAVPSLTVAAGVAAALVAAVEEAASTVVAVGDRAVPPPAAPVPVPSPVP